MQKRPRHTSSDTLSSLPKIPADSGYRMPAEWDPHSATWLAWPHYRGDWPGKFEPIPWVYAEIIRHLAQYEPVELIVQNAAAERSVRKVLKAANAFSANVRFHRWPTNRVWMRDSGCIFLTCGMGPVAHNPMQPSSAGPDSRGRLSPHDSANGQQLALKFRFNGWAKYSNHQHDEKVGRHMARATHAYEIQPMLGKRRIVLEGGSIDVNGRGALLTTEECLLSKVQERNPGMTRAHYEKVFADYLGAGHVVWLGRGILGDDTHGHVDDLTRFVAPDTVVTMVEPDRKDPNHEPLRANLQRLKAACDQDGKPLNVVEIPMPSPVCFQGRRLPASYANFYIANGLVLVPVFNDRNDRVALNMLASLFPGREIVPIYSGDLIWGFGAIHCMTQQQPALQPAWDADHPTQEKTEPAS